MSIIGSFSFGSASAVQYSTIEELLIQLPDNDTNLIVAQDVRDSVYTLWERTNTSLEASTYLNPNPTTATIGGIPQGTVFNTPTDMQTMWDLLLYPYSPPMVSIGINYSLLEFGNLLGLAEDSIELNWSVIKKNNNILSIIVNGVSIVPNGGDQSGITLTNGTHSWNSSNVSQTNTFSITVYDGQTNTTSSTQLTWMNKFYWGTVDLSSIGNPNLTFFPEKISIVTPLCNDFTIRNLMSNELRTSKDKFFDDINGGGNYLIFAFPSSFTGADNPKFYVNGFLNTAFSRVRTNSPFENEHGYITNYEVWVSNTIQNSPLDIQIN